MTPSSDQPDTRLRLPRIAVGLFVVAVVLLPVGAFFARVSAGYTYDWALTLTALGTAMLWFGAASLFAAFILVGVRAIAQQHLDVLLREQRDR